MTAVNLPFPEADIERDPDGLRFQGMAVDPRAVPVFERDPDTTVVEVGATTVIVPEEAGHLALVGAEISSDSQD